MGFMQPRLRPLGNTFLNCKVNEVVEFELQSPVVVRRRGSLSKARSVPEYVPYEYKELYTESELAANNQDSEEKDDCASNDEDETPSQNVADVEEQQGDLTSDLTAPLSARTSTTCSEEERQDSFVVEEVRAMTWTAGAMPGLQHHWGDMSPMHQMPRQQQLQLQLHLPVSSAVNMPGQQQPQQFSQWDMQQQQQHQQYHMQFQQQQMMQQMQMQQMQQVPPAQQLQLPLNAQQPQSRQGSKQSQAQTQSRQGSKQSVQSAAVPRRNSWAGQSPSQPPSPSQTPTSASGKSGRQPRRALTVPSLNAATREGSGKSPASESGKETAEGDQGPITTLMIRNLPHDLQQSALAEELDRCGFKGLYDCLYMPSTFATGRGKGYAFVNFISPEAACSLIAAWHFTCRAAFGSTDLLNVSAACLQGREANLARWDTSKMRRIRNPNHRPLIFLQAGQQGARSNSPDKGLAPR